MPDDVLRDGLEDNNVIRDTIDYLKNQKETLVNDAFQKIKISNPRYMRRLNDKDIKIFKHSIINGHLEWILDDMYNNGIDFNKYNSLSLKDVPQAYCDIYKFLIELTNNIDDFEIREVLHDYFSSLKELYPCKN